MNRLLSSLGLTAGLALTGCEKEAPAPAPAPAPGQTQTPTILKESDHSMAALAADVLKRVEAVGAEQRGDAVNAGRFRKARAVDATPFPQVELGGAVFSVIHNARTGVFTLLLDRGGHLGTPGCYAFEGNPETPVVSGDGSGRECK